MKTQLALIGLAAAALTVTQAADIDKVPDLFDDSEDALTPENAEE